MRLADRAAALLAPGGPVSRAMPGFEARAAQVQMARAVAETLEEGGVLLVEAPTGSGKGLAYLAALAAYLSRRREFKAVASTATVTLQEQLVLKDLPVVNDAVGALPTALLKGMGRYLCLLKFRGLSQGLSLIPPADLETFGRWVASTKSGDQNELPSVPSWWGEVAADHSDCLGSACSLQLQCFALQAKEAARRAQLLVTNHHLLLLYRRFAGSATSPLPNTAPVVVDESHHLADIATEIYGESCSDFTLIALAQRLHGLAPSAKDPLHRQIDAPLAVHRGLLDAIRPKGFEPAPMPTLDPALRGGYLETLRRLSSEIGKRAWEVIRDRSGTSANERAAILIRMLDGYIAAVQSILEPASGTASWVEQMHQRNVTMVLRNAPIDIGGSLDGLFGEGAPPAVLCSATLAAGGSFAHLKAKLGIQKARELVLPPLFDYQTQMRYYLRHTPLDPKSKEFTDQVATELLGLLRASEGRALVLFTSYEQLRAVAERLRGKLPYTLLVQDQGSTTQLLQQFKEDVHSVLLATSRFWEGIDIPGEALSLLVVARLPFDVPTHPLARARFQAAKARGENPFATVVVPDAIIRLRQGVGRLIRSTADHGVVAILDGRVQTQSYGRRFMSALPAAPHLRSHDKVAAFLRRTPAGAGRR
jgi:ATP-dependent DNA helicase DinG